MQGAGRPEASGMKLTVVKKSKYRLASSEFIMSQVLIISNNMLHYSPNPKVESK